jgi:hypothetical protein
MSVSPGRKLNTGIDCSVSSSGISSRSARDSGRSAKNRAPELEILIAA